MQKLKLWYHGDKNISNRLVFTICLAIHVQLSLITYFILTLNGSIHMRRNVVGTEYWGQYRCCCPRRGLWD